VQPQVAPRQAHEDARQARARAFPWIDLKISVITILECGGSARAFPAASLRNLGDLYLVELPAALLRRRKPAKSVPQEKNHPRSPAADPPEQFPWFRLIINPIVYLRPPALPSPYASQSR